MPTKEGELSTFRIRGLDDEEIWRIGQKHVCNPQGKSLRGRADFSSSVLTSTDLVANADDIPPRHVNIVGWPEDKSARKLLAIDIAKQSSLKLIDGK